MVANEKALLGRIKDCYKSGGYTVMVNGGRHTIIGGTWAVEISSENLPRDVIGLMAVHMGFLPEPGSAYKITKAKDGAQVQSVIREDAEALKEALEGTYVGTPVARTGITMDGCNVWQQIAGTLVHLIRPDLEELFRKREELILAGNTFRACGEISKVWVLEALTDPEDKKINCLSSIRWTA